MAYLVELKGSLVTNGNKVKGSGAPTLFDTRNALCLVDNPNDILRPLCLYGLMRSFAHPYQESIDCYKGNWMLLDQHIAVFPSVAVSR
jgi:hypothetical protein